MESNLGYGKCDYTIYVGRTYSLFKFVVQIMDLWITSLPKSYKEYFKTKTD